MDVREAEHSLRLLRLLQLTDSAFPTGAYAFSTGVEGLQALRVVQTANELQSLIVTQIEETLAGIDLPACFQSCALATAGNLAGLLELDQYVQALTPVPVFRSASSRVGKRLLTSARPLLANDLLDQLHAAIKANRIAGLHPVVHGAVMHSAGIDAWTTALAFASGFVNGQVAAGVRLGLLGQTAAQAIIRDVQPTILSAISCARVLPRDEMGGFSPLVDLAGLRQPLLASRLFGS